MIFLQPIPDAEGGCTRGTERQRFARMRPRTAPPSGRVGDGAEDYPRVCIIWYSGYMGEPSPVPPPTSITPPVTYEDMSDA